MCSKYSALAKQDGNSTFNTQHSTFKIVDRKQDGLQALGAKTEYKMDYAPEVLETFVNKQTLRRFVSVTFLT